MKITLDLDDLRRLISDGKLEKDGATIQLDTAGHNVGFSTSISHGRSPGGSSAGESASKSSSTSITTGTSQK